MTKNMWSRGAEQIYELIANNESKDPNNNEDEDDEDFDDDELIDDEESDETDDEFLYDDDSLATTIRRLKKNTRSLNFDPEKLKNTIRKNSAQSIKSNVSDDTKVEPAEEKSTLVITENPIVHWFLFGVFRF